MVTGTSTRGFTLVELLIVVVVLGILTAVAVPQFDDTRVASYDAASRTDLRNLITAAEQHFQEAGGYPDEDGSPGASASNFSFQPSDGVAWSIAPVAGGSGFRAAAWHEESEACFEVGLNASGTLPSVHQASDDAENPPTDGECGGPPCGRMPDVPACE